MQKKERMVSLVRSNYESALAAFRVGAAGLAECRLRRQALPEEVNGLRLLGLACLAQNKLPSALEPLERAVAIAPDFLHARTDLARAYRAAGQLDAAETQVRKVLKSAPSLAMAWLAYGDILVDQRKYPDARAAFRRAQWLDPQRVRLDQARRDWQAGKRQEAEQCFRRLLQENSGGVGALCGLAAVYLNAKRPIEAERLLLQALVQSAHCPAVWRLFSQVYLESSRLMEALAAINRALEVEPRNVQSLIALGAVNGRLMRPKAALAAYQEAERISPRHPLLNLSIGHVLKALGRRRECERVYRECIVRDRAPGEAYWSLADLKNYRFSDDEIAAMEAALAQSDDEGNAARLHFALGRAREQREQTAQAFAHYAAGNRLRRSQSPFDFDAHEAKCARVISSMDSGFFEKHRDGGDPDDSPIFIVGLPRSGSTLVEQILASHSCVEGTMELPNILNYVREFECMDARADAYPESMQAAPRAVFEALGRRYLEETKALRGGRARFIDKLPNNFAHIGLIHAMLPNATIIDVRRHPMDSGLSCFKQHFAQGQSFSYDLAGLGRYYRQYLTLMDHWDRVLPGKVLHLSYEELIRAPEPTVRRLLSHCGLRFEGSCLRFHETKRAVRTASSEQVRQPLYTSGVGYWRKFERELQPLQEALGDCLTRFPEREVAAVVKAQHTCGVVRPTRVLSLAIAAVLYAGYPQRPAFAEADEAIGEIVVTARKRTESLQEVPQAIQVFTAEDIKNLGLARFEDYVALAPSIAMISIGPGQQRIFMRGVSDGSTPNFGYANLSTTAFLIDDLSLGFYGREPDIHLYDIERIEVLNGPQGTLFGPGAMSGAVRIVTKRPDLKNFSAGLDADGAHVQNGGNNWTYEGYLNVPLIEDRTGLRLSVYKAREGGYIDNVLATRTWNVNGVTSTNASWAAENQNTRDILGGRAALLQNIAENWQLSLTGYFQQQRYSGSWEDDPSNVGERLQRRFSPAGGYNYDRFLEANLQGDVGIGDLIYIGGFSSHSSLRLYDFSEYAQYSTYASLIQPVTCVTDPGSGPGDHGCRAPTMFGAVTTEVKRRSNELRLQSKAGGRMHWTLGAYWEKTRTAVSGFEHLPNINFSGEPAQYLIAAYGNVATPLAQEFYSTYGTNDYLQTSEFGDLTLDLNQRLSAEAGVEHFHSSQSSNTDWAGYFFNEKTPSYSSSSSGKSNFRAGINFKADPRTLLYLSFAQGFRDGGINSVPTDNIHSVPTFFKPDTLNSFELGWKSVLLGGHLTWNGAAYYMSWRDYQAGVSVPYPPYGFNGNFGDARIFGLESTLELLPVEGLRVSLTGNYNDARLRTDAFQNESLAVLPGERLPEAPIFNFSAVVRYERSLRPTARVFAQVDVAHKGSMWNALQADFRTLQPAYTLGNLRFGVSNPAGHWQAEAYVTNVANKRAVIYANTTGYNYFPGDSTPDIATPPRTMGLRLGYRWGK